MCLNEDSLWKEFKKKCIPLLGLIHSISPSSSSLLLNPFLLLLLLPLTFLYQPLDSPFCVHLPLHVLCGPVEDSGCGAVSSYDGALLGPLAGFRLVCGQTCLPLHQCPSLQDQQPLQVRHKIRVSPLHSFFEIFLALKRIYSMYINIYCFVRQKEWCRDLSDYLKIHPSKLLPLVAPNFVWLRDRFVSCWGATLFWWWAVLADRNNRQAFDIHLYWDLHP